MLLYVNKLCFLVVYCMLGMGIHQALHDEYRYIYIQ